MEGIEKKVLCPLCVRIMEPTQQPQRAAHAARRMPKIDTLHAAQEHTTTTEAPRNKPTKWQRSTLDTPDTSTPPPIPATATQKIGNRTNRKSAACFGGRGRGRADGGDEDGALRR